MGTPHVNLDLNGAEIRGELDERNPPIYLPNQPSDSPLLALDIGGKRFFFFLFGQFCDRNGVKFVSILMCRFDFVLNLGTLIKLVYFSNGKEGNAGGERGVRKLGGKLHFTKFETRRLDECLDFIVSKKLLCGKNLQAYAFVRVIVLLAINSYHALNCLYVS